MEAQAAALRSAVQALYTSSNRTEQHSADAWLQEFRSSADSWRLCLALLASSSAQDQESYFAANSLRCMCSKSAELVAPDVLSSLLPQLASCLLTFIQKTQWPVVTQLSAAIAALVLRSSSWAPGRVVQDLEVLVLSQVNDSPQQQSLQVAQLAMLQVLAALPPACADRQCSVHPNRRLAVTEALCTSASIQSWVQASFQVVQQQGAGDSMGQLHLRLGMQLIHGWCELGCMPLMLPQQQAISQHVCNAVMRPETATAAAETLVSMFVACKDIVSNSNDVLPLLVRQWQAASKSPGGPAAAAVPKEVQQGVCSVLCAAGSALLPAALAGVSTMHALFGSIAEQLLAQLTSENDEVVLTALEFWQDTYLTTLQGLPAEARQTALLQHTGLLQQLTSALVLRARLKPEVAAQATADARDLPEEVRMVRRELSSALRDIMCLVGMTGMSQYLASIVQTAWQQAQSGMAAGLPASSATAHLECALYAANVVLGQGGLSRTSHAPDTESVRRIVEVALLCLRHAGGMSGSAKLAGTALTLLGGMPGWLSEHPEEVAAVLAALVAILQSGPEKLARNAATTVYRLCQHAGMAQHLIARHSAWVEGLVLLYQSGGGVQHRVGHGNDLSTTEMLLAALCRLAVMPSTSSPSPMGTLLVHVAAPKLQELRTALEGLVACGPAALQALAHAPGSLAVPSGVQLPGVDPGVAGRAMSYALQAKASLGVLQMVGENATAHLRSDGSSTASGSTSSSAVHSPAVRSFSQQHGCSPARLGGAGSFSMQSSAPGLQHRFMGLQLQHYDVRSMEQVAGIARAVWEALQPCMPQLQHVSLVMNPASEFFSSMLRCLPAQWQPQLLLWCVLFLGSLPALSLAQPKALELMSSCLEHLSAASCAGAADASYSWQFQGSAQSLSQGSPTAAASASGSAPTHQSIAISDLQGHMVHTCSKALAAACPQSIASSDPDLTVPVLKLACCIILYLPAVLVVPGVLDGLLNLTVAAGRSYDMDQCKQWLEWVTLLCTAPFCPPGHMVTPASAAQFLVGGQAQASVIKAARNTPAFGLGSLGQYSVVMGADVPRAVPVGEVPDGLRQLASVLDGSAGGQLVLAMLMAASGDMPPDLVLNIATALHQLWTLVGTIRFTAWLHAAIVSLAPERAPWYGQKTESKISCVQELISKEMECDLGRFKRQVKALCGGKKKNGSTTRLSPWPSARLLSRSGSARSNLGP